MSDVSKARLAPDLDERDPGGGEGAALPEDRGTPGDQERPMTGEERLDEAVEESFPASDPIAPGGADSPPA